MARLAAHYTLTVMAPVVSLTQSPRYPVPVVEAQNQLGIWTNY